MEELDRGLGEYERKYYETLNEIRDLRRDFLSMVQEFGKHEKQINKRVETLEKSLSDQRVTDAEQTGRINVLWTFLIDKNGLIILGILAYVIMGRMG